MDTDQIMQELRLMRGEITDNHVDVVQRLSVLETQTKDIPDLEQRVGALERYKYYLTGAVGVFSFGSGWLTRKMGL